MSGLGKYCCIPTVPHRAIYHGTNSSIVCINSSISSSSTSRVGSISSMSHSPQAAWKRFGRGENKRTKDPHGIRHMNHYLLRSEKGSCSVRFTSAESWATLGHMAGCLVLPCALPIQLRGSARRSRSRALHVAMYLVSGYMRF